MNPILKSHCETGNFSRGYLLIGERENARLSVRRAAAILLEREENLLDSHPDFSEQFFDSFGLKEIRDLRYKTATRPFFAQKRVFSLGIVSLSRDATLPFIKILEDSPLTCHFFIIVSFLEDVPHLARSRLVIIPEDGSPNAKLSVKKKDFYENFLKEEPVKRLLMAKDAAGDRRLALEFLNELEVILIERLKKENCQSPIFKNLISNLEDLKTSRQYLSDRASFPKLIIEHFALTLPRL